MDLAVTNTVSDELTSFLQLFRTPHANQLIDPAGDVSFLQDPRSPPRYRLDLNVEGPSLTRRTQICMVPAVLFGLPRGDDSGTSGLLVPVTDAVTLLRETTDLDRPARLTLRVRPGIKTEVMEDPSALRVYRKDTETGMAIRVEVEIGVDFASGLEVAFNVWQFGTYVVVTDLERGHPLLSPGR